MKPLEYVESLIHSGHHCCVLPLFWTFRKKEAKPETCPLITFKRTNLIFKNVGLGLLQEESVGAWRGCQNAGPDKNNTAAAAPVSPCKRRHTSKDSLPLLPVVCRKTRKLKETDSKANPDTHPASAAGSLHNFRISIAAAGKQGFAFMDTGRQAKGFSFLAFVFLPQNKRGAENHHIIHVCLLPSCL